VLQLRHFLARNLHWVRRHHPYSLSQMMLALAWALILGLDRFGTASLLHSNGAFQIWGSILNLPSLLYMRRKSLFHAGYRQYKGHGEIL